MKNLICLLFITFMQLAAFGNTRVETQSNEVIHWIDKDEKIVQFVADSKLKIFLQKVELLNGIKGLLFVSLEFDPELLQSNLTSLGQKYPGYELRRIWARKEADLAIDIPILGIQNLTVNTRPGVDGPYFETLLEVNGKVISQLEAQMKTSPRNIVKIIGDQSVTRIDNVLKERVELPISTCYQLARGENMYSALIEFADIIKQARSLTYRYSTTRDQLEKQILVSCLNINIRKEVNSFSELLGQKVEMKENARAPRGETYKREHIMDRVPVNTQIQIEVQEEP